MERNPNELVSQNTAKAVTRSVEMAHSYMKSSKCDSSPERKFPLANIIIIKLRINK